jgi:hypothetical protein
MVVLYVQGNRVGTLAELDKLIPQFAAQRVKVEFRDEAGNALGTFTPTPARDPNEPLIPWEPNVTWEEIERRAAEPGMTYDEVKKRLGWE